MADRCRRIAIIGAGFSGTSFAIELLRRLKEPTEIFLIERRGVFGPGLAYSTPHPQHLLNVCAAKMSVRDDEPQDFVSWLARRSGASGQRFEELKAAFVPRMLYGRYLQSSLRAAIAAAPSALELALIPAEVTALREHGDMLELLLRDRPELLVDRVVLAVGNPAPAPLRCRHEGMADSPRVIDDPWAPDALAAIEPNDRVALVGSGLTAVDTVLTLAARGHRGAIHSISRHGLLPRSHAASQNHVQHWNPTLPPRTARDQLQWMRAEIARAMKFNVDWRCALDAVRPQAQALWCALSLAERRRFLRHLRVYWDIHRHRMAPNIGAEIAALCTSGRLVVTAGRIIAARTCSGSLELTIMPRGAKLATTHEVDRVINCTGPDFRYGVLQEPLVRDLLAQGHAQLDELGLGLETTLDHRLVGRGGRLVSRLHVIGPLTRGALGEITSVPELRHQCAALATALSATNCARRDAPRGDAAVERCS